MPYPRAIDPSELERFLQEGRTTAEIASLFNVSEIGVEKAKQRWGLRTYEQLTDEQIDALILTIPTLFTTIDGHREVAARLRYVQHAFVGFFSFHCEFPREHHTLPFNPNIVEFYRVLGFNVAEHRVRARYNWCFPMANLRRYMWVALRLIRRVYRAPYFCYSWHTDLNCKLVDLSIFWTANVDGATRAVLWLAPIADRRARTVFPHFHGAATCFGMPDQLVTDHGKENVLMSFACNLVHNLIDPADRPFRPPHVVVMSILNVRIERLWGDVNVRLNRFIRMWAFYLEGQLNFNPSDPVHLGAFHRVTMPALEVAAAMYMQTRNNRRIKGPTAGIPARMMVSMPRPEEKHRPCPDLPYAEMYQGNLAEEPRNATLHDPIEGTVEAVERDLVVQNMLPPGARWECIMRGEWALLGAMWRVDMDFTTM